MKAPKRISLLLLTLSLAALLTTSVNGNTALAIVPQVTCPFPIQAGDVSQRSLAIVRLNKVRTDFGVPAVSEVLQQSKEAQAHATYMFANSDDVTVDPTVEDTANPCYSNEGNAGATYGVLRPGQPWLGTKNNISNGKEGIDSLLGSVFNRLYLLDPRLTQVGVGIDNAGTNDAKFVLNAKRLGPITVNNPFNPGGAFYFPVPSLLEKNVPLTMTEGEYPNPLPDLGLSYPTGYPFSVIFGPVSYLYGPSGSRTQVDISVDVLAVSLTTAKGENAPFPSDAEPVEIVTVLPGDGRYSSALRNTLTVIPRSPLVANSRYKLNVNASITVTTTPPGGPASTVINSLEDFKFYQTIEVPTLIPTVPPIVTPPPTPGVPGLPTPPPVSPAPVGGGFFNLVRADATNGLFFRQWQRADDPVLLGKASRSWTFGEQPYGFATLLEPYAGINRIVNYHDKARMEAVTSTSGNISNGLLVRELVSGFAQVGDYNFIPRTPAQIAIAGDISETNIKAPTYYSFYNIASLNADRRVPNQTGQTVIATVSKEGVVNINPGSAAYNVINVYYDNNLGHNIPQVFWNYMNQSGTINIGGGYTYGQVVDWLSVFGLPLTDAYWARAVVGGVEKDVLVQLFERRVLTFTPLNPDPFKVEMGNVGRHYVKWRYNINY